MKTQSKNYAFLLRNDWIHNISISQKFKTFPTKKKAWDSWSVSSFEGLKQKAGTVLISEISKPKRQSFACVWKPLFLILWENIMEKFVEEFNF